MAIGEKIRDFFMEHKKITAIVKEVMRKKGSRGNFDVNYGSSVLWQKSSSFSKNTVK